MARTEIDVVLPRSSCPGAVIGFVVGLCVVSAGNRMFAPSMTHATTATSASTDRTPPPLPPPPPPPLASPPPLLASPPPGSRVTPPPSTTAPHSTVAACIGGLLSLDIVMRGRSVRLGVLEPLQPDVFVAGTLNATHAEASAGGISWKRRVAQALDRIGELAPFANVSVEPQPSAEELAEVLRRSGHFESYEKQVSAAGAGRMRPEDIDARLWLPTMLSPALGNPQANTLREFHYQSRCMDMIEAAEAQRRRAYRRVLFTRLENHWVHPHPPLALLSPSRVWVPAGEDNGGINDRHWLAPRHAASLLMRRWEAILDGSALQAIHGGTLPRQVHPRFISSEIYLMLYARYHRLAFGRFPMLAYLACCEDIYRDSQGALIGSYQGTDAVLSTGDGYDSKAKTCFQAHCNRKRCPTAPPLQHHSQAQLLEPASSPSTTTTTSASSGGGGMAAAAAAAAAAATARAVAPTRVCDTEQGRSGFKYDNEGSAAIINAELLGMAGAAMAVGAGPPARVEITVPLGEGGRHAHMYFCFGCSQDRDYTPSSNLTAGCLFSGHKYDADHLSEAIQRGHNCRYFHTATMRSLCASFARPGDAPDHRGKTYAEQYFPWWCRGLPAGT